MLSMHKFTSVRQMCQILQVLISALIDILTENWELK